jgi:aminoglycoside phosphotransferase family enzyme
MVSPAKNALAAKVAFLSRPESYPGRLRQVRYPFLDFASLAARRRDSLAEFRLNRPLAPDVYLGVVALKRRPDGSLRIGGAGRTVDWLVKMRRLPERRTLEHALRRRAVGAPAIAGLAGLLAAFYGSAQPVARTGAAYRRRFEANIIANRRELSRTRWRLPRELVRRVTSAQLDFLRHRAASLEARATGGRIVEGHGDLRPEHIYLGARPLVLDCLEFNRAFRIADPADEMSFLALECERLGAPRTGRQILERYWTLSGERPPPELLAFYKSERACLRARIAISHLKEPSSSRRTRWRELALRYLGLADRYARALASEPSAPRIKPSRGARRSSRLRGSA